MNRNPVQPANLAVTLLLSALLLAPAAFAQPGPHAPMGPMPGGMVGMHGGPGSPGGMHGGKGMHGGGHQFGPHNAAAHFLQMADWLELTDSQVSRIRDMRDAWISAHAIHEAELDAAQDDLRAALFAPEVDKAAAEKALATIGTLEGQLWRDFVEQLAALKGLLDKNQRARLAERHRQRR